MLRLILCCFLQPSQVALCVLQYLSWVVQANSRRKDVSAQAGPAEAALARRLLDVVKAAGAAEATGALHRRMISLEQQNAWQTVTRDGADVDSEQQIHFTVHRSSAAL